MSGKLIFVVGMLGIGGYVGHNMASHDPAVFEATPDQVRAQLADARTSLPRRDGPGEITIWSIGTSDRGVALRMKYSATSPTLSCEAVVTPVDGGGSRAVADCGGGSGSSAMADTQAQLRVPMFDEHIRATLEKRPFDRAAVDGAESAIAMKNMGGMQREALREADRMQGETAGAAR